MTTAVDPDAPTDVGSLPTVADAVTAMDRRYPPDWAESWDRVGLVVGEPEAVVRRILLAVDCVPQTVAEALEREADLMIVHHPLLLRGVSSVATTTYKGTLVHRLIRAGIALHVAHTNADVANPGVSDALASRLGLRDLRPLRRPAGAAAQASGTGTGRFGRLPAPMTLAELGRHIASRLPATPAGVRVGGDPAGIVELLAVSGGAGDEFLTDARAAGADAYLTSDLRHHPASEHLSGGGPALLDAAHWATERPWLDALAVELRTDLRVEVTVSDLVTDVWTMHQPMPYGEPSLPSRPGQKEIS